MRFLPSLEAQSKSGRPLLQIKVKTFRDGRPVFLYRGLPENAEGPDDLQFIDRGIRGLRAIALAVGAALVDVDEVIGELRRLGKEGVEVPGEVEVEVTDRATGEVGTLTMRVWKREVER